jgi:hypothetical protein
LTINPLAVSAVPALVLIADATTLLLHCTKACISLDANNAWAAWTVEKMEEYGHE